MINTSERFVNFILAPNSAAWVLKKKKKRERALVSMFSLVSQPPSSHGRSMSSMVNNCILQCGLAKIITKQLGIYSHHSLMVLLKGARPAVSQSDAWARSGQLYMFACGCKQCINTSHKTTRFWRVVTVAALAGQTLSSDESELSDEEDYTWSQTRIVEK